MAINILYHSVTGNTERIARAISEELSCSLVKAGEHQQPIEADVLFIGGACYATQQHDIHPDLDQAIRTLDPGKVGIAALFSTGFPKYSTALEQMRTRLQELGIPVYRDTFFCRGKFFLLNRKHPDKQDLQQARDYARNVVSTIGKN